MLVIKPIQKKAVQERLVTACGGRYNADALAYAAYDCADDAETVRALLGVCQFSLRRGYGAITALLPAPGTDDTEAMTIMARTAAFFLYRCGYPKAVLEDGAADPALVKSLGFRRDAQKRNALDLEHFYNSPCHAREHAEDVQEKEKV